MTDQGFRLSPIQRRLWPWVGRRTLHTRQSAVQGTLSWGAAEAPRSEDLRRALETLVARHEILRTHFVPTPGRLLPVQSISEDRTIVWSEVDLLSTSDAERAALCALEVDRLDAERGPTLTALCLRGAECTELVLTFSALCVDRRSLHLLAAEFGRLLAAPEEVDDEESVEYVQVAEYLNAVLVDESAEEGREFWRAWCPVEALAVELPVERAAQGTVEERTVEERTVREGAAPVVAHSILPATVLDTLRRLATDWGATTEAVLLATWQALLWRSSGRSRLAVATVCAGREHEQLETVIGPLATWVPMLSEFTSTTSLRELSLSLTQSLEDGRSAQELFEGFEEVFGDPQAISYRDLPIGFEYVESEEPATGGGLRSWWVARDPFKLGLVLSASAQRLVVELQTWPGLVAAENLEHLVEQYCTLLASALERPDASLGRLGLLGSQERGKLVGGLGRGAEAAISIDLFSERFTAWVRQSPDALALTSQTGEDLSYGEVMARVEELATRLRTLDVGPDVIVGVALPRGVDLVIALLAVHRAGAAYLPLDPADPPERLATMLRETRAPVLLTHHDLHSGLPTAGLDCLCVDSGELMPASGGMEGGRSRGRRGGDDPAADHLAYVIYTSGSTGRPKGTLITRRGLANYLAWAVDTYTFTVGGHTPLHTSAVFDLTVTSIFLPLMCGGTVVVVPEEPGVDALVRVLRQGVEASARWDLLKLTPSHLSLLGHELPDAVISQIGSVVLGGEALLTQTLDRWRAAQPAPRVFNEYGPTETVVGCTIYEVGAETADGATPIGRPIANTRALLFDARLELVPQGWSGELAIGGPGLARGYLERPAFTAERFVPDPLSEQGGQRLYLTGDLVRWEAAGEMVYLGRRDHQIKVRGFRIEPGEIEAALAALPTVSECVVGARALGSVTTAAQRQLVAWFTTPPGVVPPDAVQLRADLGSSLPEHLIPGRFQHLERMPLTSHGKIDRAALPDPGGERDAVAPWEPPANPTEEILAAVLAQVLGLEKVGVEDNIFALGGDSIRSVQVVAIARKRGLEFTVNDVFEYQTVRGLAEHLALSSADALGPESAYVVTEPFSLISAAERARLPAEVEDAYPLTRLQAGMLYHMELQPDRPAFHNINTCQVRGPFDPKAFRLALKRVFTRHAALRTSFDLVRHAEPLQWVWKEVEPELLVEDLSQLSAAEQEDALREFWAKEMRRPFHLGRPPLQRYALHRRGEHDFQFTLTELHVILDGWSTTSTFAELFREYLALVAGETLPEPPVLATTFRDFVALEARERVSEEHAAFWRQNLADATPTVLPRWGVPEVPGEEAERVVKIDHFLPLEMFRGLRRISQQEAVPFKSVLLGVHLMVLGYLSGEDQVVSAIPSNGRPDTPDGAQLRGLFLNMLPLRLALPAIKSWNELARAAFEAERALVPHRRYPLPDIQKVWGDHELSEVLFNYLNFHSLDEVLSSDVAQVLDENEDDFSYTNYTLVTTFSWFPHSERVRLMLEYDPTALRADQIAGYLEIYLNALDAMVRDPSQPPTKSCWLPASAQEQVRAWGGGASPYPRDASLPEILAQVLARASDAVAMIFDGRQLSYGEVARRAQRLARILQHKGLQPEECVGLCGLPSAELFVATLAIVEAGGTYLPLDPNYPVERLAWMLDDAEARLLLTASERRADFETEDFAALKLDILDLEGSDFGEPETQLPPLRRLATPTSLAYVIYTSGSTGRPKGVAIPHRAIVRLVRDTNYVHFDPEVRVAQISNISFDAATFEIWGAFLAGGCLVGVSRETLLSPTGLTHHLRQHRVGCLVLATALFHEVVAQSPDAFSSVRALYVGGDTMDPTRARQMLTAQGPDRLVNGYGPTESTTFAVCGTVQDLDSHATKVPIGRPISQTQICLFSSAGHPTPIGTPGELLISGDGLARAYLRRPALTAERFVPHPLAEKPGDRLYRTGDQARYLPDGQVEFLGRRDHQVKIRGFRVELGEIEVALRRQPGVEQAVAVVHQPGPNEKILVAYFVVAEPESVDLDAVREDLVHRLPGYMVPAILIPLASLPLTPNGKVDRRALPTPERLETAQPSERSSPRTPTEEALAAIWAQVLRLDHIGRDDDFFALGGDSILSLRVVALAQERGLGIGIEHLFTHPTLSELAEVALADGGFALPRSAREREPLAPFALLGTTERQSLPAALDDAYPLSRMQLGMLYHLRLDTKSPAYHNVRTGHVRAPWDPASFQQAVDATVARHPMLRTAFDLRASGEPLQLVYSAVEVPVAITDLRALSAAEQNAQLDAFLAAEFRSPFDLTRAPLLRFHLHRRSDTSFQLTLVECHAITDGWSTTSTLAEIFQGYLARVAGASPTPAPTPTVRYADFVALERQALESLEHRNFWIGRLRDKSPPQLLLEASTQASDAITRARHLSVEVSSATLGGLREVARSEAVPLKSVLLAAHVRVLSALFGSAEILTGLTTDVRPERRGAEEARGLFLNTLPLCTHLEAGDWRHLLRQISREEAAMLRYRHYPIAAIQELWGGEALMTTNFNYVNFHSLTEVLTAENLEPLEEEDRSLAFGDFTLGVTFASSPADGSLRIDLEVDATKIGAARARRLLGSYGVALEALAMDPDAPWNAPLESSAQRHQQLVEWNDTVDEPLAYQTLSELVAAVADRIPDRLAVATPEMRLSYASLLRRVRRLGGLLRDAGVGPETLVAMVLERSPEMIIALLAILEAGGAFLSLDPSHPAERHAFLLGDSRVGMVLTHEGLGADLPVGTHRPLPQILHLRRGGTLVPTEPAVPRDEPRCPGSSLRGDNLAYVIYTSGSTGRPKGVQIKQRDVVNLAQVMVRRFAIHEESQVLQFSAVTFDASVAEIAMGLGAGAELHLPQGRAAIPGPDLFDFLLKQRISHVIFPPSVLAQLPEGELPALATVTVAGEACPPAAVTRWAPGRRFINAYGPTEATVCTSMGRLVAGARRSPIGYPIDRFHVVVGDRALRSAAMGTPGELLIGGSCLARGYLGRPGLTAERFVPDALGGAPGARLYRSGDLARYLSDGRLEFLGRIDNQIKVRGIRIEPGEIEVVLSTHPAVQDAVVLARDSGHGMRLVAWWVARQEPPITSASLRRDLSESLPVHMVPELFMRLDSLPLTPHGKVDRKALPAPDTDPSDLAAAYVAPGNAVEEMLAGIVAKTLQVERVGIDDNFFDLGANSLLLLRLHAALVEEHSHELSLVALFEHSTVRTLAQHLVSDAAAEQVEETVGEEVQAGRERLRRRRAHTVDTDELDLD